MSKRYARQLHSADDLIAAVEQYGYLHQGTYESEKAQAGYACPVLEVFDGETKSCTFADQNGFLTL